MTDVCANLDAATAALTDAKAKRKEAERVERVAQANYNHAMIEYGRANPPREFAAGDKVRRRNVRHGQYNGFGRGISPDKIVIERGIIALCDDGNGYRYRNHQPSPGEWFVLSASGVTAYKLFDKDGAIIWEHDQ